MLSKFSRWLVTSIYSTIYHKIQIRNGSGQTDKFNWLHQVKIQEMYLLLRHAGIRMCMSSKWNYNKKAVIAGLAQPKLCELYYMYGTKWRKKTDREKTKRKKLTQCFHISFLNICLQKRQKPLSNDKDSKNIWRIFCVFFKCHFTEEEITLWISFTAQ